MSLLDIDFSFRLSLLKAIYYYYCLVWQIWVHGRAPEIEETMNFAGAPSVQFEYSLLEYCPADALVMRCLSRTILRHSSLTNASYLCHVFLRVYFRRDLVFRRKFIIIPLKSEMQHAEFLTKPLSRQTNCFRRDFM